MERHLHTWESAALGRPMHAVEYGHWGFAVLLFPTADADEYEAERCGLIDAAGDLLDRGVCKIFAVEGIAHESWLNEHVPSSYRARRQDDYSACVAGEIAPLIHRRTSPTTMILTAGASLGAYQAANAFFRRPDLFAGMIGMSGSYDATLYTDGFCDDAVYFNSPMHFLPNLTDPAFLRPLRASGRIHLLCGQGDHETPEHTTELAEVLGALKIPHHLELWGHDMPHDWPTWRPMLPHVLARHQG
jgi:esterase/lipase superfamily enzyme